MDDPLFRRLAILGLGLIGGSVALAVRTRGLAREIVSFDPNVQAIADASAAGIIEQGFSSPELAVDGADGVILAAPVRAILQLLSAIGPMLPSGTFVLDLGSTKREIVAAMDQLPSHVSAVSGHPMAGKESSGLGAADPDLFVGAPFALCATARTNEVARERAERVVTELGACPLWLDAESHDSAVARISHLPYLLSAILVHAAAPDGVTRRLAATGYRDTSRLALSDPTMMLDILLTNRAPLRDALADARAALDRLDTLLSSADEAGLRAWMEEARGKR
ncbi:MAG: prephenate dehydrogenase [Chloroflexota bacterium]|nr:prephenate dehydrogenase [Chloroflexota bacterium]